MFILRMLSFSHCHDKVDYFILTINSVEKGSGN